MGSSVVIYRYFSWHYGRAFIDMFLVWANLVWFVIHFFSVPLLLRTLFSPWRRMTEDYERKGFQDLFESIVINTLSRIVGAIIRLVIIFVGLFCTLLMVIGMVCFVVFWIFMPFLLAFSLLYSVTFLF